MTSNSSDDEIELALTPEQKSMLDTCIWMVKTNRKSVFDLMRYSGYTLEGAVDQLKAYATMAEEQSKPEMKALLALYVNVSHLPPAHVEDYLRRTKTVTSELKSFGFESVIIPTRESETRIECVYPKYLIIDNGTFLAEQRSILESLKEALVKLEAK